MLWKNFRNKFSTLWIKIEKKWSEKHFFDRDARPRANFNYSKKKNDSKFKPKKIECPKIQTQNNRMTQDEMVVKVWINMKSYYEFIFQYCVFFIQRIQVSDTKIERPKK